MEKLRIFVSSVQKELESERLTLLSLVSTDPFLKQHCEAVLYELEPASPVKALGGCMECLESCDFYLALIWKQYGHEVDSLSITHHEYRRAKAKGMPVLVYIKGNDSDAREPGTVNFLKEIRADDFKYKRFGNIMELQREVRGSLVALLRQKYGRIPTQAEDSIAVQTIKAKSEFESQPCKRLRWEEMDLELARKLVAKADGKAGKSLDEKDVLRALLIRGLVWTDPESAIHYATAAGIVMIAPDPSAIFPHCRIQADAYKSEDTDGEPMDQEDIRAPLPLAIDRVAAFIDRNTRHPMKVIGLNRVRMDEYPVEALREALVNAAAHRDYEETGRRIMVEKFADRIVVSSPGLPPPPLTIPKLRTGKYKPCSRNPIIAQSLSFFDRIEERGSGIRRMREQMINHGLEPPTLASDSGYFQVIFTGPGNDMDRLLPAASVELLIQPSVEQQLTERQKKMVELLAAGERLASRECERLFGVTRDTANRDFGALLKLGVIEAIGAGRSRAYVLKRKA
jgi:predicted HTH transcriptional regulator